MGWFIVLGIFLLLLLLNFHIGMQEDKLNGAKLKPNAPRIIKFLYGKN